MSSSLVLECDFFFISHIFIIVLAIYSSGTCSFFVYLDFIGLAASNTLWVFLTSEIFFLFPFEKLFFKCSLAMTIAIFMIVSDNCFQISDKAFSLFLDILLLGIEICSFFITHVFIVL